MSEKINLQDLSALLAEKAAITKKEAESFLREYFEVMNEELFKSELLKIKDLGIFKLSLMEDRESINVTTGERVLIPAHYKVVFTPDKKLAETINEPFAFFETTEIKKESVLEELKLLPEEDVLEEFELALEEEEEEIVVEKELIPEEETVVEKIPTFEEEETVMQEEPMLEAVGETVFEEELIMKEQDEEKEVFDYEDELSTPDWVLKNYCINCHDFGTYRIYRKKYHKSRKKLNQLRVTIYILSVLLVAALGFIVYPIIQSEEWFSKILKFF